MSCGKHSLFRFTSTTMPSNVCSVGDLQVQGQAHLAILSGLVYNLETITTVIAEETMYEPSVVQYFTEKGIEQGIQDSIQEVLALRFQLIYKEG